MANPSGDPPVSKEDVAKTALAPERGPGETVTFKHGRPSLANFLVKTQNRQ